MPKTTAAATLSRKFKRSPFMGAQAGPGCKGQKPEQFTMKAAEVALVI
jgi:hypothetical protein